MNKFLDFSNAFKPREYTPKYYEELLGEAMRKECATWQRASEADRFPSQHFQSKDQVARTNLVLSIIDSSKLPLTAIEIANKCGSGFRSAQVRDSLLTMIGSGRIVKGNSQLSPTYHTFMRGE
jgi:hypothetical protein